VINEPLDELPDGLELAQATTQQIIRELCRRSVQFLMVVKQDYDQEHIRIGYHGHTRQLINLLRDLRDYLREDLREKKRKRAEPMDGTEPPEAELDNDQPDPNNN